MGRPARTLLSVALLGALVFPRNVHAEPPVPERSFIDAKNNVQLLLFKEPCAPELQPLLNLDLAMRGLRQVAHLFYRSRLWYEGKWWESCWLEGETSVFSFDEEGWWFEEVPSSSFKPGSPHQPEGPST